MSRPSRANALGTYEVGYGKPPPHTRLQKGRSGNPKGQRRSEGVGYVLKQELGRPSHVRQGDRSVQLTALQGSRANHDRLGAEGQRAGPARISQADPGSCTGGAGSLQRPSGGLARADAGAQGFPGHPRHGA